MKLNKIYNFQSFLESLLNKTPFSFSRYGDGEWNAIFNHHGVNCDGHVYYPDMSKRLRKILKTNPPYILGMQNLAKRIQGHRIDTFLNNNNINVEWVNSDILHRASINGNLDKLFNVLKETNNVLIGPSHLRPITKKFDYNYFIEIPKKNCWLKYNNIKENIKSYIENNPKKENIVFLFSASMMANILVDDMYNLYKDKHYFLDVGSIFEPYVGVQIRKYHQDIIKR